MSGTLRNAELHLGEYAQQFGVRVGQTQVPDKLFDGRLLNSTQLGMRSVEPVLQDYFDTQAQRGALQRLIELFGTPDYQIDGVAAVAFLFNFHLERLNQEKQRDEALTQTLMSEVICQWQQEVLAVQAELQTERETLVALHTNEEVTEVTKADFESPLVAGVDYAVKESRKRQFFLQLEKRKQQKKEASSRIQLLQAQLDGLFSFGNQLTQWWLNTTQSFALMMQPTRFEIPAN